MNPLDYAATDAFVQTWAPPTHVGRSLGPHVCIVQPHFARVAASPADPVVASQTSLSQRVICTGRTRIHLPTPHAGSCPLDYTALFVTLHRCRKEKLLRRHASSVVPLLGRSCTSKMSQPALDDKHRAVRWSSSVVGASTGRVAPPSQNVRVTSAGDAARVSRASTSAHRAVIPEGLTVVEQAVPATVAAVMAQVAASMTPPTATTTAVAGTAPTAGGVASPRVSHPSPPHHHHHHHHNSRRLSTETRVPSTQQSPLTPQPQQHHHHHHHVGRRAQQQVQTQERQVTPQHPSPVSDGAPQTAAAPFPQHMRYRVGRSGSTQLQTLPVTNGEATLGVGAAGAVVAAAPATATAGAEAREVAASMWRATAYRRSASPFSSLSSSVSVSTSTSLPREASATPLSLTLSSIPRSGTRGSSSAVAAAASTFARLPRPTTRASHRRSLRPSGSHEQLSEGMEDGDTALLVSTTMSASAPAAADAATPNGLADTRMFLRPPPYSLRGEERLYASANSWNAGVLLAGSPLAGSSTAASSTLYRSARVMMDRPDGAERAGAGAASAERQRELQQQLQRALARQRRLERLMFHDGDDNAVGEAADEEESTEGFNDEDDDVDVEPLWQSSPLTQVLLPGTIATAAAQPSSSLPQQPSQEDPPPYRVSSVHPHVHVSLSRFREAREDEGDLGIRADSVLDVPREWRVVGRVRNTTTSPSPQPDPSWVRRQRRQQRRGGGRGPHQPSRHQPSGSAATTAEGSPAPTPASTTSTRAAAAAAAATAREASMTAAHRHTASTSNSAATVSRSAAMAPTSSQRGGSGTSEADTDAARMPTATSTSPITTAMSPSMLSVMTAALRGPSSMSLFAPSLPRHTERAQEAEGRTRPAAVAEGDADTAAAHDASVSPVLPSPIRAVAVRRPSMPSAALTDIVWDMTVWKGDSAAVADPAAATAVVLHCPRLASAAASSFSSSASSSSPSWRRSSPQVNGAGRCAGGRRVVRAVDDDDDDDDPHVGVKEASACRQSSPAPAQLPNEAAVPRRRRPAPRWAEAQGSEERKRDADGEEVADSVSLPASGDFDSPSPAARCGSGQGSAPSSGAFRALDEAADSEVPTVRRTSPGVSEPSSKCTRSSAGEDGGSSGSAQAAGSAAGTGGGGEDRESTSEHSASLRRASSASASPAPQHRSTDDDAILFHATSVGKEAVDTPQVTAPRSTAAAAAAAPMLFLSDMLRLSFSPGRDDGNDGDDNAAGESNDVDGASSSPVSGTAPGRRYNSMSAATPRSAGPPASRYFSRVESHPCDTTCEDDPVSGGGTERYPPPPPPPPRASDDGERTVTRGERSGVATTSISSSPPSPNRTAIRHAASLMTEEEEDGYAEGGPPHSSLMSARSPFYPSSPSNSAAAAAASHLFPALSITPRTPTGVSNRLALSMDERGLYASTASTVAWDTMASLSVLSTTPPPAAAGDRPSFAQPRFSEDSLASCTTRSPAAAVFSTPAETRLMSLLRASTWAASTHQDDDAASEQRVEEEEEEMCTPRRCADLENVSHSSAFSSPAPPLRTSDSSPFPNGTREADGAAAAGASTAMMPPPPSFSPSLFTAMAPPQSSPFRGSGSFLHVPPSWSACHNITTNAVEEGRPSDGFEADIQLLARMTRMTVGGNGAAATAAAAPPIPSTPPKHNAEEQQQQQQRRVPSPSSSPVRFSTNSLSFFITAAGGVAAVTGGGRSPAGARRDDDDDRCRMRSGSGVYGSAVASRRSWAPRKARPGRRGKQPRTRASVSGGGGDSGRYVSSFASAAASYSRNPYHQLRFTSELTSPSPSARPSGGDGSSRNSVSGVVLLPQRLTFGSAIPSLSSQLASTVITSEGVSDSGERCSTALSTPTGNVFPPPQQQQRQRKSRPSPPSYSDAVHAELSGDAAQCLHLDYSEADEASGEGLRSPSLPSLHGQDPEDPHEQQQQQQHAQRSQWMHATSMSPSVARTPSCRTSLLSADFLQAPRRALRDDCRRSWTPSVDALLSCPPSVEGRADSIRSPFLQGSFGMSEESGEFSTAAAAGAGGYAPPRRPRRPSRASSFSLLRSPSASGTRLTWGTATSAAAPSEARPRSSSGGFYFHGGGGGGSATPLRMPLTRTSGLLIESFFSPPPPPPPPAASPHAAANPTATAAATTQLLTLADELRSFSSPVFGPLLPPSSSSSSVVAPPSAPAVVAPPASTFLASPPRRSAVQLPSGTSFLASPPGSESGSNNHSGGLRRSGAGPSQVSLPPALQALLMRGSNAATTAPTYEAAAGDRSMGSVTQTLVDDDGVEQGFTTPQKAAAPTTSTDQGTPSPVVKTPSHRRGCSERREVNVEHGAARLSPPR